jgi:predicted nucleic acid-binding protein
VFCLDTNVVIFAMNERKPKIVERLHRELAARTPMIVPAIVMFELEYGCAKSNRAARSRSYRPGSISQLSISRMRAKPAKSALFSKHAASRSDLATRRSPRKRAGAAESS